MFGLTPYENRNSDMFDVFRDFRNLEKRFFDNTFPASGSFCTDIKDEGDHFLLEAELPGFKKEEISIDLADNVLTISAARSEEKEDKDPDGKYLRRERSFGSFQRSFGVENVDVDKIQAKYENGVLALTLPKKLPEQPVSRRLEIH